MNELYLNISKPRRNFKDLLGQANHYIITALIGLDYIEKNDVICPADFSTSWNPRNKVNSVERTRHYILNSSLAWAVDSLDMYLSTCNHSPKLLEDISLIKSFDDAGRSIEHKFISISDYIKLSDEKQIYAFNLNRSLSELAIQWRNNTTHYYAQNEIRKESRDILLSSVDEISKSFCGLDIERALERFDKKNAPTFKETTSLIRGIQNSVKIIDLFLLTQIDIKRYAIDILNNFFKAHKQESGLFRTLTQERQLTKIANILREQSFSTNKIEDNSPKIELEEIKQLWEKQ